MRTSFEAFADKSDVLAQRLPSRSPFRLVLFGNVADQMHAAVVVRFEFEDEPRSVCGFAAGGNRAGLRLAVCGLDD